MLNLHKAQDAIAEFLKGLLVRVASLLSRAGAAADEIGQTADAAERAIDVLTPEAKQVLAEAKAALEQVKRTAGGVAITIQPPTLEDRRWQVTIKPLPPDDIPGGTQT